MNTLEIYQKQTNRRLDGLEKNTELILKILNKFVDDMEPEIDSLKNALHLNRENQQAIQVELKKNLKEAQFSTEDKIDDIAKILDGKEILNIKPEKFAKLMKLLKLR